MKTTPAPGSPFLRLSPETAFVVHASPAGTDAEPEILGRVEHIASGKHARFSSALELAQFLRRTLVSSADAQATVEGAVAAYGAPDR